MSALLIALILSAPFWPGIIVALFVMGDEVLNGAEDHGR